MEDRKTIEPNLLEEIAGVLKVPVEAIQNFDEESAVNLIASTFHNRSVGYVRTYAPTFNSIDKLVEVYEENKKLYERLLQSEKKKLKCQKGY